MSGHSRHVVRLQCARTTSLRVVARYARFVAITVGLVVASSFPGNAAATSCDSQAYQDHLTYADWVFLGTVVEAKSVDAESHDIEFHVTDIDRLRGDPPDRVALRTNRGAYDPRITIGDRYIVFVKSADRYVGFCLGFTKYAPEDYLNVLLLRKKGDCGSEHDREIAVIFSRQSFFEQGAPVSRQQIESMLRHYQNLSPQLQFDIEADRISVKGIRFDFTGDLLSAIERGQCPDFADGGA